MKRNNKQAAQLNEAATGASTTSNQAVAPVATAEASGNTTSGGSSSSSSSVSIVDGNTRSSQAGGKHFTRSYNLIEQLYPSTNSEHQEQLLLAEQGGNQRQVQTASKTRFTSRFFTNRSPAMVKEKKGGDRVDGDSELIQESAKTTAMKMSRNNNNTKNTNSGSKNSTDHKNGHQHHIATADGDDIESQSKLNESSNNSKTKSRCCCLLSLVLLMGFLTIVTIAFYLLHSTRPTDNGGRCPQGSTSFKPPTNKLFATKTLYSTTLNFLSKSDIVSANGNPLALAYSTESSSQNNNNSPSSFSSINAEEYDKKSVDIPEIFLSTSDSLETTHKKLVGRGCTLENFQFYGRHAARLPNAKQIANINKTIAAIQSRIDLLNYQALTTSDGSAVNGDHPTYISTAIPTSHLPDPSENKSNVECTDPLLPYKLWTSFATPEQGNSLMESGVHETRALAKRLKSLFPEMFNALKTNISVYTSNETRTGQTAISLLRSIDSYNIETSSCKLEDFPTESISDKMDGTIIPDNDCVRDFVNKHQSDELHFHDFCSELTRDIKPNHNFNLKDPARTDPIAQSVSIKLKLTKENQRLTSEEVKVIYDVCKYESALKGTPSIWCSLFSNEDLKFYEYLNDIDDFFNSAYGDPNLARSACQIKNKLIDTYYEYHEDQTKGIEAHFHFTHSEVIARLIASSVDLSKDSRYQPETILKYLEQRTVPKDRQWQTSLFTPFSANIAFNLYKCPKMASKQEFNVRDTGTKLVVSLNEQPIKLAGCDSHICDFTLVRSKTRLFGEKPCDLTEICKVRLETV